MPSVAMVRMPKGNPLSLTYENNVAILLSMINVEYILNDRPTD